MGHLIPMAFNSIIIILIGNAHPWASMGMNVTIIAFSFDKEKWNGTIIGLPQPNPWESMGKNVTVIGFLRSTPGSTKGNFQKKT